MDEDYCTNGDHLAYKEVASCEAVLQGLQCRELGGYLLSGLAVGCIDYDVLGVFKPCPEVKGNHC